MNNIRQPKKLAIIYILKVLQEHSDYKNTLTQARIAELVEEEYGMSLDRKSVRHNLSKLIEAGYPLRYREEKNTRTGKNGIEQTILTDWYYDHENSFDISELQIMIDSLLFSNYLPPRQCRDLVKRIADLGEKDDRKRLAASANTVINRKANKSLFYTISTLIEAIAVKRQVSFNLCYTDINFKPVKKCDDNGNPVLYIVRPYKLLSLNGRYYMLGYIARHDEIRPYRIDRITDIQILDDAKQKPISTVDGYKNGLDLSEYVSKHPNMWNGEVSRCEFICNEYLMNDVADWFGSDTTRVRRLEEKDKNTGEKRKMLEVSVLASEDAMFHWALQYADQITVTKPERVRERVAKTLREAVEKYEKIDKKE